MHQRAQRRGESSQWREVLQQLIVVRLGTEWPTDSCRLLGH